MIDKFEEYYHLQKIAKIVNRHTVYKIHIEFDYEECNIKDTCECMVKNKCWPCLYTYWDGRRIISDELSLDDNILNTIKVFIRILYGELENSFREQGRAAQ